VEHGTRVDAVEREVTDLVAALARGPLDAPVPTCPDFTVDDLARHVGAFCGFWSHVLCEGTGRPKPPFSDDVGDAGRVAWLDSIASGLVGELRATPPETTVWTWHPPDQRASFVARRCSHELAVHRVDMQLARGTAAPIDPELAADGVGEVWLLAAYARPAPPQGTGQRLELVATDVDGGDWVVTLGPAGAQAVRGRGPQDLSLRGAAGDLELLLYQRPATGEVEWTGDPAVLDVFHREFTF
jgi:uncharacterized protein (TIGR03083 family)